MFDPALAGYWGSADHLPRWMSASTSSAITPARSTASSCRCSTRTRKSGCGGICRRACCTYTGDDFNFPELIAGDAQGFSHALLGIFDAIAPAASAALDAQGRGDMDSYWSIFAPTVPLSRHLFGAPTRFYKTGIVFLAYLNGHQSHFVMVGGQQSARSLLHLVEAFKLADAAGLIRDPDLAAARLGTILRLHGVA